jgi:aspartate kinase
MLKVMKFGGASVADAKRREAVARLVARRGNCAAVVVVSAQLGHTDELLAEIKRTCPQPPDRTTDVLLAVGELRTSALLAASLQAIGVAAEVVSPWRVFETDDRFGDATIRHVNVAPVRQALDRGVVAVLPGFVGATGDGALTTLGRGGSDYSAVAIAVALEVNCVELYKGDVDGLYDRDPHTCPDAQLLESLTHEQAVDLAGNGAKVFQAKAARLALQARLPVIIRPTFGSGPGTFIRTGRGP